MLLEVELKKKFGKVTKSGQFFYFQCPTCPPEHRNKKKRYISDAGRTSYCWICEQPISIEELLNIRNIQFEKPDYATRLLTRKKEEQQIVADPYRKIIPINELPDTHIAKAFFRKDHLHEFDKYAKEYGIGYIPPDGGMILRAGDPFISSTERLYFPVYWEGKKIGWQLRALPGTTYGDRPDCLRYYHRFSKGSYLFNFENAKRYPFTVVVEGVKKCLKFNNGVATWGKGISFEQKQLLMNWSTIVFMLDAEPTTQVMAEKLAEEFRMTGKQCININLGDYGYPSPDEVKKEELHEIVAERLAGA